MSNQKRVWEAERAALDEKKKVQQLLKEREEERQILELQQLQEESGGTKRQARVEWMYNGPSSGQAGATEEMEGYLLGKRRIDGLLKGSENQKLEKSAKEDSFMTVQNANSSRDTAAKIREDPLLAIKRQEQAAYEAMMNDPIKRQLLLKAAGREESRPDDRARKRRKHHHHHRSHKEEPSSRSRYTSRHYDREDDDGSRRDRVDRRRRRSDSWPASLSRSPSPRRARRSPTRRRRSYSPDKRDRSRSPYLRNESSREVRKMQSWHSSRRPARPRSRSPRRTPSPDQDDRATRLAEMQQNASTLDNERIRRSAAILAKEKAELACDERERAENAKYGGRAGFVNRLQRRAGDMDLGERMERSRAGMERQQEAY